MTFLDSMPAAVTAQRELLRRLLDLLEPDPCWRWLELGCSLARGAGDELSDVDCGAGTVDWPGALERIDPLVQGLGEVVDVMHQWLGARARHTFVQYAGGLQLSLVVSPSDSRPGLPPGSVALMDKDGTFARPFRPESLAASPETVREWTFLGWIALSDLLKYLRRGSLWEAHGRLIEARDLVFRLWAAHERVDYPGFGLTALLDAPSISLPAGIDETVVPLDREPVLRAARRCAALLREIGMPLAMGEYVGELLRIQR